MIDITLSNKLTSKTIMHLFKFLTFALLLGVFSTVQAMELEQPEYVGAIYSSSGKGPITFEQWRTDNCSLKKRDTLVIGNGESEMTFNLIWKKNNKYSPSSDACYLDKGKILISKNFGIYGEFFYTKTKEGERLIIRHIPPISDESSTFAFYLIRQDGGVRHIELPDIDMLCESLKTTEQSFIRVYFEPKQMLCKGDSIIVPGLVGRKNGKKLKLIMQWNDNAQWFDASIEFDQ